MRRWMLSAFALSAAVLLLSRPAWKSEATNAPHPVAAAHPEETHAHEARLHDGAVALRVTGTVMALKSATLTAPRIRGSRSGLNRGGDTGAVRGGSDFSLVLVSLAKPGSPVKTGDVVAQFDAQSQQDRLDDYRDTVVQLETSIQSMRSNLVAIKEAQEQSVRQAKADWDKAIWDLKTAPVLSDIDVEKGKLAAEEAEAAYRQMVAQSALLEASQKSQIRVSELNLAQARLEYDQAKSNVERMTIHAPIDGIAVMANVVRNGEFAQIREGDQVNAGQPFLSIVDPDDMALNAVANQVDAERLELGMKARIRLDAYPALELPGTVVGLGALARTSTFRANYVAEIPLRIHIERADSHLLPDLTGSAELELQGP